MTNTVSPAIVLTGQDLQKHFIQEMKAVDDNLNQLGIPVSDVTELSSAFCLGYIYGAAHGELLRRNLDKDSSFFEFQYLLQMACKGVYQESMMDAYKQMVKILKAKDSLIGKFIHKEAITMFGWGNSYAGQTVLSYGLEGCHQLAAFVVGCKTNRVEQFFQHIHMVNGISQELSRVRQKFNDE